MKKSLSVLTVLGEDRPGIIAGVTGVLFREGCNLEDISMTVLEREFAMMMVVCLDASARKRVEAAFSKLGKKGKLDFFWKDISLKLMRRHIKPQSAKTYLVSAIGRDRTGIVFKVSQTLAASGINITDLNSKILGKDGKTLYAMILEAQVPAKIKIPALEKNLQKLAKSLHIEISLRPFERIEF